MEVSDYIMWRTSDATSDAAIAHRLSCVKIAESTILTLLIR